MSLFSFQSPLFWLNDGEYYPQQPPKKTTSTLSLKHHTKMIKAEDGSGYEIIAHLAGYSKENVQVYFENEYIIIEANKNEEDSSQSFSKAWYLPQRYININNIVAKYKNGLLTVTIPSNIETNNVKQQIAIQ